MPHMALDDADSSTLDLPGDWPLLVTGDLGWAAAVRSLPDTGAPLGVASLSGTWQAQFDIARNGRASRPAGWLCRLAGEEQPVRVARGSEPGSQHCLERRAAKSLRIEVTTRPASRKLVM